MNKLYTAFLELVRKINDDALKVFDDALTYILRYLSIDKTDAAWPHGEKDNQAFAEFLATYLEYQKEQTVTRFWYDAWGDMFMELSGKVKSFRGQFFTPSAVADLCAQMSRPESTGARPVINGQAPAVAIAEEAKRQIKRMNPSIQLDEYEKPEDIPGFLELMKKRCGIGIDRSDPKRHRDIRAKMNRTAKIHKSAIFDFRRYEDGRTTVAALAKVRNKDGKLETQQLWEVEIGWDVVIES